MIKIRYADLPGGLHVRVAASGKDTIIYLLPGLTTVQRRAALRRARSSARMGHGPDLPGAGVASAVVADGMRTTLRNVAGAMRIHPGLFFPPIVIISFAAVAYILLVSVTAGAHSPQAGGSGGSSGDTLPQAVAPPPGSQEQAPAPRPTSSPARSGRPRPSPSLAHHTSAPSPTASPRPSATAPGTTARPSPSPTPTRPAASASPSPRPSSPNPGGTVAKTSGSSGGQLCLHVGPLGACLSMSAAR